MAIDSLYCAYLKAYHTYEFYEVLLQVFSDKGKKDKVQALKQEMLLAFGIKEGEYKFGVDNRHFAADKEKGVIQPSLLSIKGFSQSCADDLYKLSQTERFDTFYDLLKRLQSVSSVDKSRLDTLIRIGYFDCFGPTLTLLNTVELFDKYYNKKQIKKDKNDIPIEVLSKYATETKSMYKIVDNESLMRELCSMIPEKELPLEARLKAQYNTYGYISYTDPSRPNTAVVMYLNTKYSTFKAQLYRLYDGQIITVKFKKKAYEQMPIAVGMVINYRTEKQPAWKKLDDGSWQKDYSREDLWLTSYTIE